MRWTALLAVFTLVIVPIAATGAETSSGVRVMFDFGTGRVLWADVPVGLNATAWNATEAAAESLELSLTVSWFGTDVFVSDIGDSGAVFPDWWHFLLWTPAGWNLSDRAASAVPVSPGATVGWFLSRDDPSWDFVSPWPGPRPEFTPEEPNPVVTFRYDNEGTGVAAEAGPVRPVVVWAHNTSAFEITGTPAALADRIFLPTWTGLVAIDAAGGRRWLNADAAGASSPTLYGGRIYIGGRDGSLHALEQASGETIWNLTLQPNPQFSGITASPRVAYGKVYVGTFNETGGDGTFAAVDLFTGELVWSRPVSSVHLSAAAIANGIVYVGLMGRFRPADLGYDPPYGVLALDAETGEERWFVSTNSSVASSPALDDDQLYVTTKGGGLLAIRLNGTVVWEREIGPSIASPAVASGRIIAASGLLGSSGALWAFDAAGNVHWWYRHPGPMSASPTIAGDLVYAATNEPTGRVIAVYVVNGTEAWTRVLEPHEYILSSPIVHAGTLYIASDNGWLYAMRDGTTSAPFPLGSVYVIVAASAAVLVIAAWLIVRRRGRGA